MFWAIGGLAIGLAAWKFTRAEIEYRKKRNYWQDRFEKQRMAIK